MNALDLAVIALLAIILIRSYLRGLIREVASLGGIVLALLVGIRFHPGAEKFLVAAFGPSPYMAAVGFGLLFVVTLLVISLVSGRLSRIVSNGPLGGLDRLLGLCFGALKGCLIAITCIFLFTFMAGPSHPLVANSRITPEALEAAEWILNKLPQSLSKSLDEKRAQLNRQLPGKRNKNK